MTIAPAGSSAPRVVVEWTSDWMDYRRGRYHPESEAVSVDCCPALTRLKATWSAAARPIDPFPRSRRRYELESQALLTLLRCRNILRSAYGTLLYQLVITIILFIKQRQCNKPQLQVSLQVHQIIKEVIHTVEEVVQNMHSKKITVVSDWL